MTTTRLTSAPSATSPRSFSKTHGCPGRVVLYTSADCWRGAGISYLAIARGLEASGFHPHVVVTCDEVAREFASAGVAATQMPPERKGEAGRLRRFLSAFSADAVLVDRAHDLRVATLAVLSTRTMVFLRYNHFGSPPPKDLVTRIAYFTAIREVVFLSLAARMEVLCERPFMRSVPATTIHEGVDTALFRPSRKLAAEFRRQRGLDDQPFLLAVGALALEKRYDLLFDALRVMPANRPPLIVFGEGPQGERLRARARDLGLDVRFEGRVPQRDLVGAYSACTALIHTGSVETFGLAVLEAMACGRPVVVSAGGALPEVVGADGSCGRLVAPNSADDFARAIQDVLDCPERWSRIGARARERACECFSIKSMERGYARLVARHLGQVMPLVVP